MNKYIQDWLDVIEYMNNENTYKLAWGRAILEIVYSLHDVKDVNVIDFQEIAHKMIKYYWNQTFFFHLRQGPNIKKKPVIVQQVDLLIDQYKDLSQSSIPIWFNKAEIILNEKEDFYQQVLKKCARKLKDDVSWRFMNINKETKNLYILNKEHLFISLSKWQVVLLKEYSYVLSQLLNYKWAQLLEKFNNAPRITSKVKGISDNQIRRKSLTKYKEILLENMKKPVDFYTGEILDVNDISVDHVIPWSFMYSDDIWNLVLTSKSNNSSKLNHIPSEDVIEHLNQRNEDLVKTITNHKFKEELNMAIANHYVDQFYLSMKL